jgi:hypothetical protein
MLFPLRLDHEVDKVVDTSLPLGQFSGGLRDFNRRYLTVTLKRLELKLVLLGKSFCLPVASFASLVFTGSRMRSLPNL